MRAAETCSRSAEVLSELGGTLGGEARIRSLGLAERRRADELLRTGKRVRFDQSKLTPTGLRFVLLPAAAHPHQYCFRRMELGCAPEAVRKPSFRRPSMFDESLSRCGMPASLRHHNVLDDTSGSLRILSPEANAHQACQPPGARTCSALGRNDETTMIGGSISRWTMSYFAAALTWLVAALALMVAGIGYPAADLAAPDTLILVHAVCIGWLSVAMCGALFQFVPVLVAKPLFREAWALPALALLTGGLVSLLAGFMALGGRLPSGPWLLPLGALLLVGGFGLVAVDLGLTAWRQPTGPARFVLVGLASLCATVALGAAFALALADRKSVV